MSRDVRGSSSLARSSWRCLVWPLIVFCIHTSAQDPPECSPEAVETCAGHLVNTSHPITALPFGNHTAMDELCGSRYAEFQVCYSGLANCTDTAMLEALSDVMVFLCNDTQRKVLDAGGACLADVLTGSNLDDCDLTLYEHVVTSQSAPYGQDFCGDVVEFLTCIRWVTWSFCGRDVAELLHDVNKIAMTTPIKQATCQLLGDDTPSGLAMAYTLKRFYFVPSSEILMRVYGDPLDWIPEYLDTQSGTLKAYIQSTSTPVSFGLLAADYWHNKLLWVDDRGGSINELPLYFTGSTSSQVIFGALSDQLSGIAVDWIAQNVYVCDAGHLWISQISYKPGYVGHHDVIISTGLHSPSGIVTHPRRGKLYWADKGFGTIESSNLDGSSRQIFKNDLNKPGALAMDYPTERLYWLNSDSHVISSCLLSGQECRDDVTTPATAPKFMDFDVYEKYIFASVAQSDLAVYDLYNGTKLGQVEYRKVNAAGYTVDLKSTHGVTISAPDKQYPFNNPCFFHNGGCAHLCMQNLTHPDGRTCRCSLGYQLGADGRVCVTVPYTDDFLLVADSEGHDIYMLETTTGAIQAVPIPADSTPSSLAYDHSGSVLWVDVRDTYRVMRTALDGSSTSVIKDFNKDQIMEIAYDLHSQQLYCTKYDKQQIVRIDLSSNQRAVTTVVASVRPVDMVLDVGSGTIYWSDWGSYFHSPGIYAARIPDGANKRTVVRTNLKAPAGLALDLKAQRLYWIDATLHRVESCTVLGADRQVYLSVGSGTPLSIALDDSFLYIADTLSRNLRRYNRSSAVIENFGPAEFQKAVSIRLYHSATETYTHTTTTTTTTTITTLPTTTTTTTTTLPTTTTTLATTTTSPTTTTVATTTSPATTTVTTTTPTTTTSQTTTTATTAATTTATTTTTTKGQPLTRHTIHHLTTTTKPSTTPTTTTITTTTPTTTTKSPTTTSKPTTTTTTTKPTTTPTTTTKATTTTKTTTSTKPTTPTTKPSTTKHSSTPTPPPNTPGTSHSSTIVPPTSPPKELDKSRHPNLASKSISLKYATKSPNSAAVGSVAAKKNSGLGDGAIVGIVLCIVIVIVAIGAIMWYKYKSALHPMLQWPRRFRNSEEDDLAVLEDAPTPTSEPGGVTSPNDIWTWQESGSSSC